MYLQSSVIRVRVSPGHHEHKRASFVTDQSGDLFELSALRCTLYSSIPRLGLWDDYSARRFVDRFRWESHEWMGLLHELQIPIEHGELLSHDFRSVVARLLANRLEVRQLPRLQPHLGIEGVRGFLYCFLPGPTPLPDTSYARHEPIFTQVQALTLINSLNFDHVIWPSLIARAGQDSQTTDKTPAGYKAQLQSLLASEQVLAYAVRDLGEAQTQAAAPPPPPVTSSSRAARPASGNSVTRAPAAAGSRAPVSASTASPPPAVEPKPRTDFSKRKGVQPASLADALARLKVVEQEIKRNGYHRKYTNDAVLLQMIQQGNVTKERFHVRLMELPYLTQGEGPGMLGRAETIPGKGAKYWSTTFDQTEDNDLLAELHLRASGIQIDEKAAKASYALVIIDTEKAKPLTGVESIVPTFKDLSKSANRELPKEFPPSVTDAIMNPEFQEHYAKHHAEAVRLKILKDAWDTDPKGFDAYLKAAGITGKEAELLEKRREMHYKLGNNTEFMGNGLTKQMQAHPDTKYPDQEANRTYGMVETFNLERQKINLDQLIAADAITVVRLDPVSLPNLG